MEGVYAAPKRSAAERSPVVRSDRYPVLHARMDEKTRRMEDVYGCPEPCDLDDSIRYCDHCGHKNDASNNFCIHCGTKLTSPVIPKRPSSEMMCVYASPEAMSRRYTMGGMGNGKPKKK